MGVIDNLDPTTREVTYTYPDGISRTIVNNKFPVMSSTGDVLGLANVDHDVTELQQIQDELAQKEAQLRIIIETCPIAFTAIALGNAGTGVTANSVDYTFPSVPSGRFSLKN